MRVGSRGASAGLLGAAFALLVGRSAPVAAAPSAAQPAKAASTAPAADRPTDPAQAADKAQAEAAAAQQAAASLEAQVIELRHSLESLERERAAFDNLRRRLDELEARTAAGEHRDSAEPELSPVDERGLWFRDAGFGIRSPDDRFALRPHARVQALYSGSVARAGRADPAAPNQSTFALAHAEVILEGHAVSPAFEYRLQVDGATPQILEDAFVQWRFLRNMALPSVSSKRRSDARTSPDGGAQIRGRLGGHGCLRTRWDLGTMLVGGVIPGGSSTSWRS